MPGRRERRRRALLDALRRGGVRHFGTGQKETEDLGWVAKNLPEGTALCPVARYANGEVVYEVRSETERQSRVELQSGLN